MTHRNRFTCLVPALVSIALAATLVEEARGQVQHCAERLRPIADGRLQRAIDLLKAENPGLEFKSDEQPCRNAKETISLLSRTLGRNYLTRLSGYEFAKVVSGEGYFIVERFTSTGKGDLTELEAALQRRKPRRLATKANLIYEVFVSAESLVLMTSSGVGLDVNSKLFGQIRKNF